MSTKQITLGDRLFLVHVEPHDGGFDVIRVDPTNGREDDWAILSDGTLAVVQSENGTPWNLVREALSA